MRRIHIALHFVDGGFMELSNEPGFMDALERLQADGYSDTEIITRLLGDDWGPPLRLVVVTGPRGDGHVAEHRLVFE